MEMVSAAKLRRAQNALLCARPYVENLGLLLGRLAPMAEVAGHPLFQARRVDRSTLVLFTADRGLCGSFNANIIRMAERYLKEQSRGRVELVCVGRRGYEYFQKRAWPVVGHFVDLGGALDRTVSNGISNYLRDRFLSGTTDEVHLAYTTYVSTSMVRPVMEKFLDLDQSSLMRKTTPEERRPIEYIFDPSREEVFNRLVPAHLLSKVYITMAESFTSEHSARMLAMNNASKNCDELMDSLTLSMNKARQSGITGDLLDIVGGANALQG